LLKRIMRRSIRWSSCRCGVESGFGSRRGPSQGALGLGQSKELGVLEVIEIRQAVKCVPLGLDSTVSRLLLPAISFVLERYLPGPAGIPRLTRFPRHGNRY